jgi:DNA-binding CsgD family transcriptional regulator
MDFDIEIDEQKSVLSRAEGRVLILKANGYTSRAISKMLCREIDTINSHVAHILQKLDAANTAQAITAAFVRGMVKSKKVLVLCLVVTSALDSVLPTPVMASVKGNQPFDMPDQRIFRGRHSLRVRSGRGSRKAQSRREQVWLDCFGEF